MLTEQLGSLRMDREAKRKLARGEFSGKCPVVPCIECPAATTIRAMVEEHAEEFRQLDHSVGVFESDLVLSERAVAKMNEELRALESEAGRVKGLREIAKARATEFPPETEEDGDASVDMIQN